MPKKGGKGKKGKKSKAAPEAPKPSTSRKSLPKDKDNEVDLFLSRTQMEDETRRQETNPKIFIQWEERQMRTKYRKCRSPEREEKITRRVKMGKEAEVTFVAKSNDKCRQEWGDMTLQNQRYVMTKILDRKSGDIKLEEKYMPELDETAKLAYRDKYNSTVYPPSLHSAMLVAGEDRRLRAKDNIAEK